MKGEKITTRGAHKFIEFNLDQLMIVEHYP